MTMASIASSSVLGDDAVKVCYAGYMLETASSVNDTTANMPQ
jgi:hypothetical protein